MTVDRIAALLEPIQNRLNAITPGKWFREYSDVITSDPDPRDVEEGYDDPRSMRIVRAAPHLNKRESQGIRNADFIAAAPTDQARLIAAIEAVIGEIADTDLETNEAVQGDLSDRILAAVVAALDG